MNFDVLVSGMMVVDILAEVPNKINKDGKQEFSKIIIQGGAPAGNGACFLAQSGLKTGFLGYKGNNTLSLIAEQEFKRCKVDTSLLIPKNNFQPAIAIVEVNAENGERTVFYSTQNYSQLDTSDINKEWVKNSQLLFVDGYDTEANIALLEVAKHYNIPSVLDLELGDINTLKEMISLGSHVILPLDGAQLISEEKSPEACLQTLQNFTDGQLIITDGANGSWALMEDKILYQPAFSVEVVDTTGCGDVYHAAYAIALLKGKNLQDRMEYASAYASIVATHFGGRSYFPSDDEVQELIIKNTTLCH